MKNKMFQQKNVDSEGRESTSGDESQDTINNLGQPKVGEELAVEEDPSIESSHQAIDAFVNSLSEEELSYLKECIAGMESKGEEEEVTQNTATTSSNSKDKILSEEDFNEYS